MGTTSVTNIIYKTPREVLGQFLAEMQLPSSSWEVHFNGDQKEYWYLKADKVLDYIKRNRLL